MTQELRAFASTSPTGGETCPVCLRRLRNSRLGKPENCDHYFCFTCIQEWAKNVNTCPVDRIPFNYIEVYSSIRGKLLNKVYIPNKNVIESSTDPNDVTYCEICHQCDREDSLLLCDGCDKGYHLFCLTPPLREIPEDDWYCHQCLPIICEQYNPSLVLESDIEDNHPNLNSHSDDDSSINVVDSDSDSSGMEWRPTRGRNQFQNGHRSPVVMIEDSSESSGNEEILVDQDSNDGSSEDGDSFHRRRTGYRIIILSSTEGSESGSDSDIDVVSIGESSNKFQVESHSHSERCMESEVGSSSSSGEDESVSDEEDIQPIGSMLKRSKSSQKIESDSDSNDTNKNSHSREPSSTTTNKAEANNSESNTAVWKNMTVPLTRLKEWQIPRKLSTSGDTCSDLVNHDDTTSTCNQISKIDSCLISVDSSSAAVKKSMCSGAGIKLEPGMEKRQGKYENRSACSADVDILYDITMTSLQNTTPCPKTNDVTVAESVPTCTSIEAQSITKSQKTQLKMEENVAGPSSNNHASSDRALGDDKDVQSTKTCRKRRRSKRNKQKAQLADCPNSKKVDTWFDFRGIESHLALTRRHSSNARQQVPPLQNGLLGGVPQPPKSVSYRYDQPMNATHGMLWSPPPVHVRIPTPLLSPPPLMNFPPCNYVRGQPPYPYPRGPLLHHPPPPQSLLTRSRNEMVSHAPSPPPPGPQPLLSINFESSNAASACSGVTKFGTYQGPPVEKQEPKIPRKRRRKRKTKLVLTVPKKSPQKSEEGVVSKRILSKRACRARRKKRRREEWKLKRDAAKQAKQQREATPPSKKRKVLGSESVHDPTYSPSKWDPKAGVQSEGCMTRARTAATNTPRRQAMREAVREAYRHNDHEEGLRFAREILAKQGRMDKPAVMENGNGNECLTTPTKVGSGSNHSTPTPQSGYVKKLPRKVIIGRHQVASIPETPPSTMSSQHGNQTRLASGSDITGPSAAASSRPQEQEQEYCARIMDEVKRRTVPSRRMLTSVLVTPVQKPIVTKSAGSDIQDEPVKPVRGRGRADSSDLINQLCQNLDNLDHKKNIIQRDGSIVPIKEDTSPPLPLDPLSSLSSFSVAMTSPTTPSPLMTSSSSPTTTPQRHTTTRSHDHPTNQNQSKSTATCRRQIRLTPQKSRESCNSTSSYEKFDTYYDGEVNGLKMPNLSSATLARSSEDGSRFRASRRLPSSDSEPGRENGLPDYVTFIPDTPNSSTDTPFLYSNTYFTMSTTSNSGATSTTGSDSGSTSSRNSDNTSSNSGAGDPKLYVKRLLKQHYHLGHISSYQFSRIMERASHKVEQGQSMSNCADKQRIKRLVDDYVEAYTSANPE